MSIGTRVAAIVAGLVVLGATAGSALAAPVITIGADGTTAPVFDYDAAIRQRVFITQPGIDQDGNGVDDKIALEIIRPPGSSPSLQVPVLIDPSPYYSMVCRGRETECIGDTDADGLNDRWPLFYDNYFVPRGYAYILAESDGTASSTGCPLHGGPGDVAGMKSVIDWLQGRVATVDAGGQPVVADWDNGKAAMIGKSYDGTLANAVAATGVQGLTTIIPISAISNWYGYSRMGGIRFNTHYPAALSQSITDSADLAACAPSRTQLSADDGDATGDVNPFWAARDYRPGAASVTAAVFATHGLQDDNVRLDQLSTWWKALGDQGVPRKLWLLRSGHTDPFDSRRGVWVDTLHRWLDHWLLGVDNGIMQEPRVDIEDAADVWSTHADWPLPGAVPTPVYLRGTDAASAGELGLVTGGATDTLAWTDVSTMTESAAISTPTGSQANRRVFLGPVLTHDLTISGTPTVQLTGSLSTTQSNLGALLVDYGAGTEVSRSGDGIATASPPVRDCWGVSASSGGDHDACYLQTAKPLTTVAQWRVSAGILDSSNRDSLTTPALMTVGATAPLDFPLVPQEHVFGAGHRIGIVLVANYSGFPSIRGTIGATVTVDTRVSKVMLPIVGGYHAAAAAHGFAPDAVAPVLAGMPADIAVADAEPEGASITYSLPTVSDDQDPSPEVACAPASGTVFAVGTTVVTCTGRDAYGNTVDKTFTLTVAARPGPPADPGAGTPAPAGPALPPPSLDRTAPVLRALKLTALSGGVRVRFALSERATVTVTIRRRGTTKAIRSTTARLAAGTRTLTLRASALRRAGRYTITVAARDAAGNRARTITGTLARSRATPSQR
jgi:X-Pro dipeptidyl-peptidase